MAAAKQTVRCEWFVAEDGLNAREKCLGVLELVSISRRVGNHRALLYYGTDLNSMVTSAVSVSWLGVVRVVGPKPGLRWDIM